MKLTIFTDFPTWYEVANSEISKVKKLPEPSHMTNLNELLIMFVGSVVSALAAYFTLDGRNGVFSFRPLQDC